MNNAIFSEFNTKPLYHRQHILTLMLSIISIAGYGQQIDVQLDVNPNLSPYLYEWEGASAEDILVTVQNPQTDFVPTIFKVWLVDGTGSEIGNSSVSATPAFEVPPGVSSTPLADLFPISSLEYNGDFEMEISQTGKLPEDNYTLCIQALSPNDFQPISQSSCGFFNVQGYQDPFNFYPPDGEVIDASLVQDVVFQWSSVAPLPDFGERYIISVYQIFPNQNPQEAATVNPSILSEEVIDESQFIVPIDFITFEPNESGYVWTVTPINPQGTEFTEPNGQSQPTMFVVTGPGSEDDCACVTCNLTGMGMKVNGEESNATSIPVGQSVSFSPTFDVVCNPDDCPISVTGQITATYSSQTAPNQTYILNPGDPITLPANGLLYLTYSGTAYCGESECICIGSYGPIQWQVIGDDGIIENSDDDHTTTSGGGGGNGNGDEETDSCDCGPCSISSFAFKQGGAQLSGGLQTGVPITLDVTIDASCSPESCPPIINGYFNVGYTPEGGSWTEIPLKDNTTTFTIPDGVTMLIVDFVGTVTCEDQPCPCDGMNNLEIFVKKPTGGGDKVPQPETPTDSIPPVPPPPESVPKECDWITRRTEPASPIDLGMVLDEPGKSPYPRAVPLRAEGIDWDYAIFECSGCKDGASQIKYPVKDRMNLGAYRWQIVEGMGSLNVPFSAEDIAETKRNIEDLLDQIKALEARKTELNDRLDNGIKKDSLYYSQALDELKVALEKLEEKQQNTTDTLNTRKASLADVNERFDNHRDTLNILTDTLVAIDNRIVDLELKLTNPPSQEELDAMAIADEKANEWENARQSVENYEIELLEEANNIKSNLDDLKDQEREKAAQYRTKSNEIFAQTRLISELEDGLYNTPQLRQYRKMRSRWLIYFNSFFGSYYANTSIVEAAQSKKSTIRESSRSIAMALPEERDGMYDALHIEFLGFATLPEMMCNGESSYESCTNSAIELVVATLDFDTAMHQLSISDSYLDPALIAELEEERANLTSMEAAVVVAQSNVEQASEAYQQAVMASIGQLAQLEQEKQLKIDAMNLKGEQAAEAEVNYNAAKDAREIAFEENKLMYEIALGEELASKSITIVDMGIKVDSLSNLSVEKDKIQNLIDDLNFKLDALKIEIENYEKSIDTLNSKLAKLKTEPAEIKKEVEAIDQEIEKLLNEIKKAEEHLAKLSQPSRFASGPEVYYIPPPLEEIFKAQGKLPEFQEFITKVDSAQALVDIAFAEKEILQKRLVQLVDNVAWNLLSYKNITNGITETEQKIKEIKQAIASTKSEVASKSQTDELSSLQDRYNEAKQKQKEAEDKAEECEAESSDDQTEIEAIEAAKETAQAELDQRKEALAEARAQLKYQENLFRNSSNTLREKSNEISEQKEKVQAIEQALGRAENEATIAKAKNEDGVSEEPTSISELESQLESEQSTLENLEANMGTTESSQAANATAVKLANEQVFVTDSLVRMARNELQVLKDSLANAYDYLKEGNNCSTSWITIANEWKSKAAKLKKALEENKNSVSESVGENEGIQRLENELKDVEEDLVSLNNSLTEMSKDFLNSVSQKATLQSEVEANLKAAKEALEEAEEELKEWLIKEFETVKFDVKIELRGDDEVVDQWRTSDNEVKLIRVLRYNGTRMPVMQNKYASGGLPPAKINAICQVELLKKIGSAPDELSPPSPLGPEPRTIALIYKNGEPIWPEWPVIPQNEMRYLQKDIVFLRTAFLPDFDIFEYFCTSNAECEVPPPITSSVFDVGRYKWELEGEILNNPQDWRYSIWEPAAVNKPFEYKDQLLKSYFNGSLIVADLEVKQEAKYRVYPGVLIEVPDTIFGVPDSTVELIGRIVKGDHKGLPAEDVEFSIRLIDGSSEGYEIVGSDTLKVQSTEGDGYAKVDFEFGDGYAKYEALVKWLRGGKVIDMKRTILIAPIKISIHKVGPGPPEIAWQTAAGIIDSGKGSIESASAAMPDCVYEEASIEDDCVREMRAIAGLTNYHADFVNDFLIEFEVDDTDIKLQPPIDTTEYFGIGHTLLKDVGQDVKAEITASVEEKYLPLGMPGSAKSGVSTEMIDEFYIGSEESPFLVVLDNPVPIGTTINGEGILGITAGGFGIGLMIPIQQVKLQIEDVDIEKSGEGFLATSGSVIWEGEGVVKANVLSFELEATKFGITATVGAIIEGTVAHETALPDPVGFSGTFEPSGNFIAGISNLPELEIQKFVLKQGASIVLDMHSSEGPTDTASFKGIFIPRASIEMPIQFSNSTTKTPTILQANNFYIGTSGVGGTLSLTGAFIELGYYDYVLMGNAISITLAHNKLTEFSLGAGIKLGAPFQGDIQTTISYSGEKFSALIKTEDPVMIPQVKAVVSILDNSGFTKEGENMNLVLNANILTDDIGEIKVDGFKISNDGSVSVEELALTGDIDFGSGFQIQNPKLSFIIAKKQTSFWLAGKVILPKLENTYLDGKVGMNPGPVFYVEINEAAIEIEYGPVSMTGHLAFSQSEFRGEFGVGFKNSAAGIDGLLIFGNKPTPDGDVDFSYWYAELSVSTSIPIAQTGVSILKLGGGLGFNYTPPMGDTEGFAVNTDALSFKALMAFGNTPQGKVLAGEVQVSFTTSAFSLYGRVWALDKRESFFGEGLITLIPDSGNVRIEGFVGMGVKLPDPEGFLVDFDGKIAFEFAPNVLMIKSETLAGSVFREIKAKGEIDINETQMYLNGKLWYDLNTSFDFTASEKLEVVLNVTAEALLDYQIDDKTILAELSFDGNWRVTFVNRFHNLNITSGDIALAATAQANPQSMSLTASAEITWDFFIASGSYEANFGYTKSLL